MKIVSYKKKKNNLYEIALSNNEVISLYDDVILKYELLIKNEISEQLLKEIIVHNSKIESYIKALKYINSKLRTEKEIRKKLNNYSIDIVDYTIDRLKIEGYLDNELYIKSYINDKINLYLEGPNKILYDLKKLGFIEEDIINYLNNIDKEIWLNKINKFVIKKINNNHILSGYMLKQKIIRELLNKGFQQEYIYFIVNECDFVDNVLIKEKEYNKLKNKYMKDLSGEELEYKIKIELMKKGFK